MIKKYLFPLLSSCILFINCQKDSEPYAEIVNIPDANFKKYLLENISINSNKDAEIQVAEVNDYTGKINCSNLNIKDLTGIEYFKEVTELYCGNNPLESLDLMNNVKLKKLNCQSNSLSSLDISSNLLLTHLEGDNNEITSIDLSKNTELINISLNRNKLVTLDVSHNINLVKLSLNDNKLSYLDVSYNPSLEFLSTISNELININIKNNNNNKLAFFSVEQNYYLLCIQVDNKIEAESMSNWIKMSRTKYSEDCESCLKVVEIPNPTFRKYLVENISINTNRDNEVQECEAQEFTGELDFKQYGVNDLTGLEAFINITSLDIDVSATEINLTNNTQLKTAIIGSKAKTLDFSKNTELEYLVIRPSGELTTLDLTNNSKLIELNCFDNKINELKLPNSSSLITIRCSNNQIKNIDTSNNTSLTELYCGNNQILSLDLSNNTNLESLGSSNNLLTSLDLTKNTKLETVWITNNKLITIDFSKNEIIKSLECGENEFTSLDFSKNTELVVLVCSLNKLTNLNLKNMNNTKLEQFNATNNPQLTCIQIDNKIYAETKYYWKKDLTSTYEEQCN